MKFFPVMGRGSQRIGAVPWDFVAAHDQQAQRNHGGQSVQRLAERGGLSWCELRAVVEDRPWREEREDVACEAVMESLLREFAQRVAKSLGHGLDEAELDAALRGDK